MEKKHEYFDVIIIGAGPAGLTAAIYAGRSKLKTLVLEKSLVGGLATYTDEILNYPGFPEGITGLELMKRFQNQAKQYGVQFKLTDAKSIHLEGADKRVETFRVVYHAKSIILANGSKPKLTGAVGEEEFLFDKGISFCATCDAASCEGKVVAVVGGGESAFEEALYLTKFAKEVHMIVRKPQDKISAPKTVVAHTLSNEKIRLLDASQIKGFIGEGYLKTLEIHNSSTDVVTRLDVDRCFLFIGYTPDTELLKGTIDLDEQGYIIVNERMETNVPGVFGAGDVCVKRVRQVATAVGDGAAAGVEVERYIASLGSSSAQ